MVTVHTLVHVEFLFMVIIFYCEDQREYMYLFFHALASATDWHCSSLAVCLFGESPH